MSNKRHGAEPPAEGPSDRRTVVVKEVEVGQERAPAVLPDNGAHRCHLGACLGQDKTVDSHRQESLLCRLAVAAMEQGKQRVQRAIKQ